MARILTLAESRNEHPNYTITNSQLRKQDYRHFRDMVDGSAILMARVLAAGGHA